MSIATWEFESPPLHLFAEIAQLVEHNLAKVGVASSSLVFRSFRSSECFIVLIALFLYRMMALLFVSIVHLLGCMCRMADKAERNLADEGSSFFNQSRPIRYREI